MASVNEKHFKAGGGNAAVKKLLAAQADAARRLTGASESSQQSTQPTEAQLARLRAKVAARGKTELDRQEKAKDRKEASETTYSGNKVFRNGKHVGNMVNGKFVKLGTQRPTGTTRNWRKGYGAQSDKPSSGDPSTWKRKTEQTPEPEKKPESEVRTLTNNNRDRGGDRNNQAPPTPERNQTPPRRPTGQGSQGFRMKADLGKLLKDKPKTESKPDKPKSRLEKALAWASDKKNKDAWKGKKK